MTLPRTTAAPRSFLESRTWPHASPAAEDTDYFTIGKPVGSNAANEREDVARAQTLLAHAGYFDMERTEGPTGWYGKPLELAIRKFQKDNGLAVDGVMLPGGETVSALQHKYGTVFAPHRPPSLKQIDEHHARRSRGEAGLLRTGRSKGAPLGVPLLAPPDTERPSREHATMRNPENARPVPFGSASSTDDAIQLASAAQGALKGQRDVILRSWPEVAPVFGGGGRGTGAAKNAGRALDGVSQSGASPNPSVNAQAVKDFVSQNRVSLELGISEGFGVVERHESENTTQSGRVVRDACLDALAARGLTAFKHVAGGRDQDDESVEVSEWTVKDGKFHSAGGGHSLPDLIFSDGKVFFAVNTATESGGKFISREIASFDRLLRNLGRWTAEIISKKRDTESWEDYRKRADEICTQAIDNMLENERSKTKQQNEQQQPESTDQPPSP